MEVCPVYCGMFISIPGLYPQYSSGSHLLWKPQMSSDSDETVIITIPMRKKHCLQFRTTALDTRKLQEYISGASILFICFCFVFDGLGTISQKPLNQQVFIKLVIWFFTLLFANSLIYIFINIHFFIYFPLRYHWKSLSSALIKCFSSVTCQQKKQG